MDVQQLRYFFSICATGSFAKAAESCFVSAQGISMTIKRLEDELSCRLFERSSKGIVLTEHAKFLLPVAERIVKHMDDVEYYFTSGMGKNQKLTVIFTWGADVEFAGIPFNEYKKRYPNIYLRLLQEYDSYCEVAVDTGEVELALVSGPIDTDKYEADFLYKTQYGITVKKDNALAGLISVNIRELDSLPLAVMGENQKTLAVFEAAANAQNVSLNVRKLVNSTLLTFQYSDMQAIGITTQSFSEKFLPANLCFVPFDDPELSWNLYLISPKNGVLSPAAELMRQMLLQHRDNLQLNETSRS